jgi:MFS family permease
VIEPGSDVPHDPYSSLRLRDFRFYLTGVQIANLGMRMQSVAVGWEIYERTRNPLALGLVGLVQVLPVILLALPAGHVADRHDRRRIVLAAQVVIALGALGLAVISAHHASVAALYGCLLVIGVARAFQQPARAALLPQVVPVAEFSNAVTWMSGGFQLASVIGPALGGLVIAMFHSAVLVYLLDATAALTFFILLALITVRKFVPETGAAGLRELLSGAVFVWRNKVILGSITLDLFAVLLGGATALLPMYAKDLLKVGPSGLGWMDAAPSLGALTMAFLIAYRPPMRKAGRAMLWSVAGFGLATIVFGVSRSFALSLGMLFLTGAFDNVSVVVRHTLVQLLTPDHMRGRVSAINGLFIGASNELGGFESGLTAHFFGPTVSVVSGGIGTIIVVAFAAIAWPTLRCYGRLTGEQPSAAAADAGAGGAFPVIVAETPSAAVTEAAPRVP